MSKTCAKCERAVYPLEELKCLDKVWHKACFKCQECGMTLSMRNYKGFNRLPYCTAHCPQAKHTTVADTPEIRRIQENTKIQSTVKYHEEFEKQKGKVTQIADDPETLRIKQNTRIISNVAYHGELERKAAMEQKRPMAEGFEDGSVDQPYSGNYVYSPVASKAAAYEKMIGSELNNQKLTLELSSDCGGDDSSLVTPEFDLADNQNVLISKLTDDFGGSISSLVTFEYDLVENQNYPGSEFKLETEMPTDDIPTIKLCVSTHFLNVDNEDGDRWSIMANSGSVDDLAEKETPSASEIKLEVPIPEDYISTIKPSFPTQILNDESEDGDSLSINDGSVDDLDNINIVLCSAPAFDILNAVGTPLNSPIVNGTIAVNSPHSSPFSSTFAY